MKPYGNFIKDYKINSYLESLEDKFTAEFNGLPEIKRIDELKTKSIIKMTRKAFMAHVGRGSHFNTVEEYLEILNDPDYVIYNQKSSYG